MQDIHSMGGVGGSLFGGGGDRRLRPHHQDAAALKCPRCDSSNTKFCYYNNYNLSQPRHFCKSCRRYWTRGGVLRNVPVGGGCRKPKRSNKPNKTTPYTEFTTTVDKSNSDSTSESSNITATTTTVKAAFPQPLHAVSRNTPNLNPSTKTGFVSPGCGFFGEMGSWTSLMDSGDVAIGFGFGFGEDGWSNWQSGGGVLDLSDTVDQAYWSQIGVDQRSDQVQD